MFEISVIIPVYNVKQWLPRCVDSLLSQEEIKRTEIILVDDGSSDGSAELCDQYASLHANIVAVHKTNGGVSSARNVGLDKASGKYIAFVDADDYVENDYLEKFLEAVRDHSADMIVEDYYLDFPNSKRFRYRKSHDVHRWNNDEALIEFLSGGLIGVNLFDKLYLREKIGNIRFDENIKIGEDLFFIFHYLIGVDCVVGVFSPIYNYYQREGSAMNASFSEKAFDVIDVSERILNWIRTNDAKKVDYAEALYIHSAYKTLERAYKAKKYDAYKERLSPLSKRVKQYSMISAWRHLSKKQFCGLVLMRISPAVYLWVCNILKI